MAGKVIFVGELKDNEQKVKLWSKIQTSIYIISTLYCVSTIVQLLSMIKRVQLLSNWTIYLPVTITKLGQTLGVSQELIVN